MVFEALLEKILSRVVGQYVEGISKDQMKVGIFSGNVDIQDETQQVRIALQIYGPGRVWFDALKVEYVDSD